MLNSTLFMLLSYSLTTAETVRVLLSYLVEVQDSSDTDRAYR